MKILVIEDQADIRDTLKDLLECNGHEVLAAEDGVEGLALAVERPDFIFCDVAMPRLDGYGVLAAIRRIPEAREVPFVFLTAKAEREAQRAGMTLGADDYITKPFTERDILNAIAARTERHRSVRERLNEIAAERHHEVNAQWAHELLTPLNAVVGCVRLLEQEFDSFTREELREVLATIRAGAERQDHLAHQLIRYFELEHLKESGGPADSCVCSAPKAVTDGAERAAAEARRTGDLRYSLEPGRVRLIGDFLSYAVYEVVRNAFHFSTAGTAVEVSGQATDARYRIAIVDCGPGLSPEQRAQIGAFVQFERARNEQQGLGLGLSIARATAALAGGELRLEDSPSGAGLQVVFDLPAA